MGKLWLDGQTGELGHYIVIGLSHISLQDPYGWFQWFCRFYQGRRTEDDERQIGRWARCAGETGRWKNNLISKIVKAGCAWDNYAVSPVVRQTLQHWAYQLNKEDFDKNSKKFKK